MLAHGLFTRRGAKRAVEDEVLRCSSDADCWACQFKVTANRMQRMVAIDMVLLFLDCVCRE